MPLRYNPRAIRGFFFACNEENLPPATARAIIFKRADCEIWTVEEVNDFYEKCVRQDYHLVDKDILDGFHSIKGYVYYHFLHQTDRVNVFENLVRSGARGFSDQESVNLMYDMMERQEYDMTEEVKLLSAPYHILIETVKKLDLDSRLSFRNTCTLHRILVDNSAFRIDKLSLGCGRHSANIWTTDGFNVEYRQAGGGYAVRRNGQTQLFHADGEDSYLRRWKEDMRLILSSNPNLRISVLKVKVTAYRHVREAENKMSNALLEVFANLEIQPKVQSLLMRRREFQYLQDILPYLDSTQLKNLAASHRVLPEFFLWRGWRENHEEVFMLEQWKNLETLICDRDLVCDNLAEHFSHFSYCHTWLRIPPSTATLIEFKEKSLLKRHLTSNKFMYSGMTDEECTEANQLLGIYDPAALNNKIVRTFRYPNENNFLGVSIQKMCSVFETLGFEKQNPIEEEYGEDPDGSDHEEDETEYEGEDETDTEDEENAE